MFCHVNFMDRLYHDCARILKRILAGKLAIVQLSSGFSLLAIPRRLPVPSRVSRMLACLVVRVPATLPVSCTVINTFCYNKPMLSNNYLMYGLSQLSVVWQSKQFTFVY